MEDSLSKPVVVSVVVFAPMNQIYSYYWDKPLLPGVRVLAPFGKRLVIGLTVRWKGDSCDEDKIKFLTKIIDREAVIENSMLEMCRWLSSYYLHPLGEVLRTALPLSERELESTALTLDRGQFGTGVSESDQKFLISLFGRRRHLQFQTLKKNWRETSGSFDGDAFSRLFRLGVLKGLAENEVEELSSAITISEEPKLSDQQQEALRSVLGAVTNEAPQPVLLWGVTGSGKTEIYLQVISRFLRSKDKMAQAIVLVPEISLTPQMTNCFEARFPEKVSVVHSGLSSKRRLENLKDFRLGKKRILIGPRSAVFATAENLRLILVDEEHDGSYKQGSGFLYHARDVAVLRAKLEKIAVVLGSATPSLESYYNAKIGKYHFVRLEERYSSLGLPEVSFVKSTRRPKFIPLGSEVESFAEIGVGKEVVRALRENTEAGNQAIVLVNRRGFAFYLLDLNAGEPIRCPHCSISLTVHKHKTTLRCHYCDYSTSIQKYLVDDSGKYSIVGFGSQQVETLLNKNIAGARISRLDSDNAGDRSYLHAVLNDFRERKTDILVGTQMLAKGHDFPNVTLVVVLEVDQILSMPDFRAGERVFQLLVQASGRAGRAELPGRVLVQAIRPDHPVIQNGLNQDYMAFAQAELKFRKIMDFPPFCRMVCLDWSSKSKPHLSDFTHQVDKWLQDLGKGILSGGDIRILGPAVPAIEKVRGQFRMTLILSGNNWSTLRSIVVKFRDAFLRRNFRVKLRIDVDPLSIS